ncbi:MAG: exo-alpha-sialidase, partial [Holophagae bacterium]|nr:exo-alpha-sialidase [Holophagae bacterium]
MNSANTMRYLISFLAFLLICAGAQASDASVIKNVTVCLEEGRYGGWPANHGIWNWGNEILVGFELGYFKASEERHPIDRSRFREHLLARSLDGGETWTVERHAALIPTAPEKDVTETGMKLGPEPITCPGNIPFFHPEFALTARRMGGHIGPSRFYYTTDKGVNWQGPFIMPNFGTPGIAARTEYLVEGDKELTMFLTSAKSDGTEGRSLCVRTTDGGCSWSRVSFIGPEYKGDEFLIMPSAVRLSPTELLASVRLQKSIDIYRSSDNGATWNYAGRPVPDTGRGNPPDLLRLQ